MTGGTDDPESTVCLHRVSGVVRENKGGQLRQGVIRDRLYGVGS